jgi:hypothetical protein
MELERALSHAEDVGTLSTQDTPDEAAAVSGPAHDLLNRDPSFASRKMAAVSASRRRLPSYWIRSATVTRLGLIVAVPITERI